MMKDPSVIAQPPPFKETSPPQGGMDDGRPCDLQVLADTPFRARRPGVTMGRRATLPGSWAWRWAWELRRTGPARRQHRGGRDRPRAGRDADPNGHHRHP